MSLSGEIVATERCLGGARRASSFLMVVFILLILVVVSIQGMVRGEMTSLRNQRESDRVAMLSEAIDLVENSLFKTEIPKDFEVILPIQSNSQSDTSASPDLASAKPARIPPENDSPLARVRISLDRSTASAEQTEWVSRLEYRVGDSGEYQTIDTIRRPFTPTTSS